MKKKATENPLAPKLPHPTWEDYPSVTACYTNEYMDVRHDLVELQRPRAAIITDNLVKNPTADYIGVLKELKEYPDLILRAASYFCLEHNLKPEEIQRLQELIESPYWLYRFALNIPGANKDRAEQFLDAKAPYWADQLRRHLKVPAEKRRELLLANACVPEAAYAYLRLIGDVKEKEENSFLYSVLKTSGQWSFLWAHYCHHERRLDFHPHRAELRETALRDPKWAYHWWTRIEDVNRVVEQVLQESSHPADQTKALHPFIESLLPNLRWMAEALDYVEDQNHFRSFAQQLLGQHFPETSLKINQFGVFALWAVGKLRNSDQSAA